MKKVNYEYEDFEEITDQIKDYCDFEDESDDESDILSCILDENAIDDLTETILHLMEDYVYHNPKDVTEPDFHDTLIESITEILLLQFDLFKFLNGQHYK